MMLDEFFYKTNDNFSLKLSGCSFSTELIADANGEHQALIVSADKTRTIHYAFQGSGSLCTTSEYGNPQDHNILEKFISLPQGKAKPTLMFFEKYGFLFPIQDDSMEVDLYPLTEIINRLKATTLMMTALSQKSPDYMQLLHLTLYLLLGERVSISLGSRTSYTSYRHPVLQLLDTPIIGSTEDNLVENETGEFYSVNDMITSPSYLLSKDEYDDISAGETFLYDYPGIKDHFYRKLVSVYKGNNTASKQQRLIIEFLFHLMHDVGVVKAVTFDKVEFYATPNYAAFDRQMQKALSVVAKIILAGEINYNVSKMRPQYNAAELAPTWKAPNLLTSLYFSAFYMKPGSEIYRKCANPSCEKYFQVKTTNSRKIYCCKKCRDAANQRSHRKSQK